jgi:hypothetical protein
VAGHGMKEAALVPSLNNNKCKVRLLRIERVFGL